MAAERPPRSSYVAWDRATLRWASVFRWYGSAVRDGLDVAATAGLSAGWASNAASPSVPACSRWRGPGGRRGRDAPFAVARPLDAQQPARYQRASDTLRYTGDNPFRMYWVRGTDTIGPPRHSRSVCPLGRREAVP